MKQTFSKLWPHMAAIIGIALFCIFYFLPENAENKVLPQGDVQHSLSMQSEIRKYMAEEGREILWTNSMFSGMPSYQIFGASGKTYDFVPRIVYSSMQLTKGISSPTGLLFACCIGFYFMMLCFRFNWKYALVGSILFGMSTSFMHLIGNGHVNKVMVLALLAPTIGSMWLIYQKKYLLGSALTALFVNLQIMTNHPQISYYFAFLAVFFVIGVGIHLMKQKEIKTLLIGTALLTLSSVIGVLPNLPKLLTTKEYSEETIRGKSLIDKPGKADDGLDKDYAFSWSLSIPESMTHVIPNFMGGESSSFFVSDPESHSLRALQNMNNQELAQQLAQTTSKYFGQQPFTAGAWYWGITVVLFFFLGFFSLRSWIRWWGLCSLIFLVLLSWGNHFSALNYFLFDYFPLFNKFRAVSMTINLAHLVLMLIGFLGLREFLTMDQAGRMKALKMTMIPAGVILILGFYQGWLHTLTSPIDEKLAKYPELISALYQDRAVAVRGDVWRTFFFIAAFFGLLYLFVKYQWNNVVALSVLAALIFIDLVTVDKRYLPNSKFVMQSDLNASEEPRPVDKEIMQDKQLSYRVADFTSNMFNDAFLSNFHKNVGGYHAAKLAIYQDVIDKYLSNPRDYFHVYGMLNTKYIIGSGADNRLFAQPNPEAMGNAWFAREVKWVDTPQQELDALGDTANIHNAVVNKSFKSSIKSDSYTPDPAAKIEMTKYIPDHMTYTYEAASPQFVVFSEVYYPEKKGWHVYIDGKRKEGLVRTNYVLRGLEVPEGKHTLEMKFEPESYYAGQKFGRIGSILLLLLLAGAIVTEFRDEKNKDKNVKE
ncbi:MAG TPA: hypothetical protein PLC76_00855 [Saprospiraceae bacterium]|nr:hypothetical protein [Saprospiraceae bacterium]HRP83241.1 hypothetical protein [Saprospiraceae bacterium]